MVRRASKWLVAAVAVVAVSSSTIAFADDAKKKDKGKAKDKSTTEKVETTDTDTSEDAEASARTSATTVTSAEPAPVPVPSGERGTTEINMPLVATGAVLFGAAYVPSAFAGLVGRKDDAPLIVPLVGPWIALGERDCDAAAPCDAETLDKALMIGSGIMQGIGATAVLLGVLVPSFTPRRAASATAPTVKFMPISVGQRGGGIGALGVF